MGRGGARGFSRIVRVELAVHAHATEDPDRVMAAVFNLVPEGLRDRARVESQVLEGHYNNPITRIVVRFEGSDAEELLRSLAGRFEETEKRVLATMVERRYDERAGRLYLRLDKQEAYLGRVRLAEGDDVVHVMVSFRGSPKPGKVLEILRELGLLP